MKRKNPKGGTRPAKNQTPMMGMTFLTLMSLLHPKMT
jgi:hypothetical protein